MAEERTARTIISAEQVAQVARWNPAPLDGSAVNAEEVDERRRAHEEPETSTPPADEADAGLSDDEFNVQSLVTAEELAAIRQAAYEEGRAEGLEAGRQEGLRQGQAEVAAVQARWQELVAALSDPLKGQEDAVEAELLRLSVALASQLVRREIRQNPGQIIAVIREAMSYLPAGRQTVRILLHPDDASFVRETFSVVSGEERAWQIQDDPTITRGGCRIATDTSNLDATLETRLASLVANMMGGERDDD